jgi:hypothetical protein
MLKYALKKLKAMIRAGFIWARISLEGPSKHRNETSWFKLHGYKVHQ